MNKTLTLLILVLPTLAIAQVSHEFSVDVSTNYYSVTSKTVRAAFREATLKNSGKPSYAYSTISSHYITHYIDGTLTPKTRHFYYKAIVTLPRFEGAFATNQYFKNFEKELIIHEAKHVEAGKANLLKMSNTLSSITDRNKEEAARKKINAEHAVLQDEIDNKDKVKFHTIYSKLLSQ